MSSLQFAPCELPEKGACGLIICDCPKLLVPESRVVPMPITIHLPWFRPSSSIHPSQSDPWPAQASLNNRLSRRHNHCEWYREILHVEYSCAIASRRLECRVRGRRYRPRARETTS